jgi:predicted Zn-dependent peptidase
MMLDSLQITELSNGIKVVTLANPHAEGVHVAIHARVGSRNETEALNGASHFIEHLLFKGTKKRSSKAIS